jgi:hypothetical protein
MAVWVGSRAGLDVVAKNKIPASIWNPILGQSLYEVNRNKMKRAMRIVILVCTPVKMH